MKFVKLFLILLPIFSVKSFLIEQSISKLSIRKQSMSKQPISKQPISKPSISKRSINKLAISKQSTNYNKYNIKMTSNNFYVCKKTKNFIKLIRPINIIPTLALSFYGGFMMNKSLYKLLKSSSFIVSVINTILIMSSGMIINDIIDISIDKTNNPDRPLVNGDVSLREAKIYVLLLLVLTEFLSFKFLPNELQLIVNLAIVNIGIYTSFLKKIPLIKNLSCAFLVAFSSVFSGMASVENIFLHKNISLLLITSYLVFIGSLCNEILLDISDIIGDKLNKINTIAVLYGEDFSLNLVEYILKINVMFVTIFVANLFNIQKGLPLLVILSPLVNNLNKIRKYNYSYNIIRKQVKKTNKPLFMSLLYLILLSFSK